MYILAWFDLFTASLFAQYLSILNDKHDDNDDDHPSCSSLELKHSSSATPNSSSSLPAPPSSFYSSPFRVYQSFLTHIVQLFQPHLMQREVCATENDSVQDLLVCLAQRNDFDAVSKQERDKHASAIIATLDLNSNPFTTSILNTDECFTLQHGKSSSSDTMLNEWIPIPIQCTTKFQFLCNIYSVPSSHRVIMTMNKHEFRQQSMCNIQHIPYTLSSRFMLKYATQQHPPQCPLALEQGEQADSNPVHPVHDDDEDGDRDTYHMQDICISSIVDSQSDDMLKGEQPTDSNNNNNKAQDEVECFDDKYSISTMIAGGGFGTVWRIRHDDSKCVKIIELGKNEPTTQQRKKIKGIVREFEFSQKAFSEHPVQCELYIDDVDMCTDPKAYLVMPYFHGQDLFDFIDQQDYQNKVSVDQILRIFHKLLLKLDDLHYNKCMLHADIKPENVMLIHAADDVEVELIDYGIAKSLGNLSCDERYLEAKGHFGTRGYVAPELSNEFIYNRKTDVFSAGVVFYNLITECVLFPKSMKYEKFSQDEYDEYLTSKLRSIRQPKVVDILYSCLAFEPEDRLSVKQLLATYFTADYEQKQHSEIPSSEVNNERENENAFTLPMPMPMEASVASMQSLGAISSIESSSNADFQDREGEEIVHEETVFVAMLVRAYKWRSEQKQWSEHGKGTVSVYNISKPTTSTTNHSSITKIVFEDCNDSKIKLLQWLESGTKCEFLNEYEIKWTEYDYSIDIDIPSHETWKLTFNDPCLAQRFANVFTERVRVDQHNVTQTASIAESISCHGHGQDHEMRARERKMATLIVSHHSHEQENRFSMQSSTDSSDSPSATTKCDNVIELS